MLYSKCQRYNGQWYQTYILIRKRLCLKYHDFSRLPTYQLSCYEISIISNAIKKNTKRYTQNTLHRRNIEMVNARLRVQHFTHPVHPNSYTAFCICFGNLWTKREKYDRQRRRNTTSGKKQANKTQEKHFSFQKSNLITKTFPYRFACAAR